MFAYSTIAKYASVYIAKPLDNHSPPFCLGCMGSDNKFNAETVLLCWNHIITECEKRGIHVVSFGGDDDSRVMRAMQVFTGLYIDDALTAIPCSSLKSPCIPELWISWCNTKSPSAVAFVQDTVHIAIKLKTQLLRPSMMLPIGDYVAGSSHLKILHANFGKDLHGLRLKDIDLMDKQNFDAIMNIIRAAP